MKVILFGATGMVGQGALLECLDDPQVEVVLALVRRPTGRVHPKLRELIHADFFDYRAVEADLTGYDACLFCLGTSAMGLSEAEYRRVTYDLTLAAATTLCRLNPAMCFLYVSGDGTDSTGTSRMMWARVKGDTENALLKLPFRAAYMLRPGFIQPVKGVVSRTGLYRALYAVGGGLYPLLRKLAPGMVTTSARLGQAMLRLAREGSARPVLSTRDLAALA